MLSETIEGYSHQVSEALEMMRKPEKKHMGTIR